MPFFLDLLGGSLQRMCFLGNLDPSMNETETMSLNGNYLTIFDFLNLIFKMIKFAITLGVATFIELQ